jgi:hypothetical protein
MPAAETLGVVCGAIQLTELAVKGASFIKDHVKDNSLSSLQGMCESIAAQANELYSSLSAVKDPSVEDKTVLKFIILIIADAKTITRSLGQARKMSWLKRNVTWSFQDECQRASRSIKDLERHMLKLICGNLS